MRHAAHKANKDSVQRTSPSALFRSSRGSHTARAVRAVQAANGDAVALAIDPVFAAKLNEVAPMSPPGHPRDREGPRSASRT